MASDGNAIGIDGGITNVLAFSNGNFEKLPNNIVTLDEKIKNSNRRLEEVTFRNNKKVINYDNKLRVEAKRQLAVLHEKRKNILKDYFHKVTKRIVNAFGTIVVEDLSLSKMKEGDIKLVRSGLQNVALGTFYKYLSYKAESAGRKYIKINPAYTSQTCSSCQYVDKNNRNGISFKCISCGFSCHSDTNAAVNILKEGLVEASKELSSYCGNRASAQNVLK